jgi:hypothetical protein
MLIKKMKIRIEPHTLRRALERGTSVEEIEDVIRTGVPIQGKQDRSGRTKVLPFHQERLGKFYEHKRLEVFFIVENHEIVTVTVYVFYGRWEVQDADTV